MTINLSIKEIVILMSSLHAARSQLQANVFKKEISKDKAFAFNQELIIVEALLERLETILNK
jgi:hypothetical protein